MFFHHVSEFRARLNAAASFRHNLNKINDLQEYVDGIGLMAHLYGWMTAQAKLNTLRAELKSVGVTIEGD